MNASTNSRYYMAALTMSFSNPVTNPVIQLAGLGGTYNSLGFSTELELRTSGYTLTELSGRGLPWVRVAQLAGFRSGESVDLSRYPAGIYILLILDANGGRQVLKVQKA